MTLGKKLADYRQRFFSMTLMEKWDAVAFACLCFFFFDCCFAGGGHYVGFGAVTPRAVAAVIALSGAIPVLLKNIRKYLRMPLVWMFAAYIVYLAVCAVRGVLAQNRMNVLMSDLKGFAWLFMVPVCLALIRDQKRFQTVLKWVVAGSVLQAAIVFLCNVICSIFPAFIKVIYNPLLLSMMGSISPISDKIFRVFLRSAPYMALTVGVLTYWQIKAQKINWLQLIMAALCIFALLFSFTRSVYGCLFVVLVFVFGIVFFLHRKAIIKCLRFLAISGALTLCVTLLMELLLGGSYLNFAFARTFKTDISLSPIAVFRNEMIVKVENATGWDLPNDDMEAELAKLRDYLKVTVESDNLRGGTEEELIAIFLQNPVFGSGLGASAPCRSDGLDEYFYLDMLARTGILGLLLYVLPFGYICYMCIKKAKQAALFTDGCAAICGLMGFWAITWFNPWMNAVLGIACYSLCSAIPQNLDNINLDKGETL